MLLQICGKRERSKFIAFFLQISANGERPGETKNSAPHGGAAWSSVKGQRLLQAPHLNAPTNMTQKV